MGAWKPIVMGVEVHSMRGHSLSLGGSWEEIKALLRDLHLPPKCSHQQLHNQGSGSWLSDFKANVSQLLLGLTHLLRKQNNSSFAKHSIPYLPGYIPIWGFTTTPFLGSAFVIRDTFALDSRGREHFLLLYLNPCLSCLHFPANMYNSLHLLIIYIVLLTGLGEMTPNYSTFQKMFWELHFFKSFFISPKPRSKWFVNSNHSCTQW